MRNLIKKILKEVSESSVKVITDYDDFWDYKMDNNKFFAKKKGSQKWILAKGKPEQAIKKSVFKIFDSQKKEESKDFKSTLPKNIIIGDSQTPYVDNATSKASRVGNSSGVSSLWKGGMGVNWLKDAVLAYPNVDKSVKNVIVCIGTNGNFGRVFNDDVPGLFSAIKQKFPNARILVVQGSWGWGGLAKTTEKQVRDYYKQYKNLGGILIEPPIGNVEPHGNIPIYQEIGSNIDSML